MAYGEKVKLTLPPDYAYGEKGCSDRIPPYTITVFEIELFEDKKVKPFPLKWAFFHEILGNYVNLDQK